MTKDEFKKAYINHTLEDGTMHCDSKTVPEGLSTLDNLITSANSICEENESYISDIKNLSRFYGFVQNNNLSEDNLFYDLNIPSYGGENTEHIIEDFLKYTEDLKNDLSQLKEDIESTKEAIEKYNNEELSAGDKGVIASAVSLFDDYEKYEQNKNTEEEKTDVKEESSSNSSGQANVAYRKTSSATPTKIQDINTSINEKKTESTQEQTKEVDTEEEKKKQIMDDLADQDKKQQEEKTLEDKIKEEEINKIQNNMNTEDNNSNNNDIEKTKTSSISYEQIDPQSLNSTENTTSTFTGTSNSDTEVEKIEIDDLAENISKNENEELDYSKLSSSVKNTESSLKPTKIATEEYIEEDSSAGKFIPPIAGVATASIAGVGTKLYMDKSKEDDEEENKESTRFFDEEVKEEKKTLSKEDLVEMLDDK